MNDCRPEDLMLLLTFLFTENHLEKVKSRMNLTNRLGKDKSLVNTDYIRKLTLRIIFFYEVTYVELILMCREHKLLKARNSDDKEQKPCFCHNRHLDGMDDYFYLPW